MFLSIDWSYKANYKFSRNTFAWLKLKTGNSILDMWSFDFRNCLLF